MIFRMFSPLLATALLYPALVTAQPVQPPEDWKIEVGAPDGIVQLSGKAHGSYFRAYQCPSMAAAEAVVAAVPRDAGSDTQYRDLTLALNLHDCVPAKGAYRVTALGSEVEIDHGLEAVEFWTVLAATTEDGIEIGLVYDSSPYAMTD